MVTRLVGVRDGGIVNSVLIGGTVTHNVEEVNAQLISVLKKLQVNPASPILPKQTFPDLPPLSKSDVDFILRHMSKGKALTFDLISDIIFSKDFHEKTAVIVRDLWNGELTNSLQDVHFEARLIPLNKKHPDVPKPEDFRPIVVMSPLVKLLEARLLNKLQKVLEEDLHRSQTGFVPGLDIYVNLHRAVQRIQKRTEAGNPAFCLFLDFKSAYNTIPHEDLFKKLRGACSEDEIQLIRAIYSRLTIVLGKERMKSNVGVAQGSMISPALFDIYAEDLLEELNTAGLDLEDLSAYADDHLIICDSLEQLRASIQVTKNWCDKSGISLNPRKSGILEIRPRRKRKFLLRVGSEVEGIPVVDSYRYLGLLLDQKLTGDAHIRAMDQKISFLNRRLAPLLGKVSLDYRINLWKTLARPLYNPLLALAVGNNLGRVYKLERNLKGSLKLFAGLCKSTSDLVLQKLLPFEIERLALEQKNVATWKWRLRKERLPVKEIPKIKAFKTPLLPKNFIKFNNLTKAECKVCGSGLRANSYHLSSIHGLTTPSPVQLLNDLEAKFPRSGKIKARKINFEKRAEHIQGYISFIVK